MNSLLEHDQKLRPDLFYWNGPVPKDRLREWLRERRLQLPQDLLDFWEETGGGELFQSETVLGPYGDSSLGDDVDTVNVECRAEGLPLGYLVVHTGLDVTAIRLADGRWVAFAPISYAQLREYDSFASWYQRIREEYAERYGLPPLAPSE